MQYDFTTLTERRGTNSMKWKGPEKELPAWVADMDFRTAPAITEAVMEKVGKGIFGYSWIPESLLDTVSAWWSRRYGWTMRHEWMHFATGVMPAIHSIVKSLTAPGDGVVVMTPVYHCFFHAIEWNGRVVREAPLHFENGAYRFDPEALEAALKEPATTLLLLCNPHNPTGELWTREELAEIGRLAAKYGVPVVSDEIHCDLTDPGSVYTPFASVNEECAQNAIVTVSPSKTFNIPGINTSFVIVPNEGLRGRVFWGLDRDQVGFPSAIAIEATEAAYGKGEAWVEEVREVLARNKERVVSFLHKELPQLHVTHREATYLVWIDCSAVTDDADKLVEHIHKTTGLVVSPGSQFRGNGRAWIRLNPATQPERLEEILRRFAEGVRTFAA